MFIRGCKDSKDTAANRGKKGSKQKGRTGCSCRLGIDSTSMPSRDLVDGLNPL